MFEVWHETNKDVPEKIFFAAKTINIKSLNISNYVVTVIIITLNIMLKHLHYELYDSI